MLDTFSNFSITQTLPSVFKRSHSIDLSPQCTITVQRYNKSIQVKLDNTKEDVFGNSVGPLGDFKTGIRMAGMVLQLQMFLPSSEMNGGCCQVMPGDGKLFHEMTHPQLPPLGIKPEDPCRERKRQLAESTIIQEEAEAACSGLEDNLTVKACVNDVLATQDFLDMMGAFNFDENGVCITPNAMLICAAQGLQCVA